jgi:hypothetical protein
MKNFAKESEKLLSHNALCLAYTSMNDHGIR